MILICLKTKIAFFNDFCMIIYVFTLEHAVASFAPPPLYRKVCRRRRLDFLFFFLLWQFYFILRGREEGGSEIQICPSHFCQLRVCLRDAALCCVSLPMLNVGQDAMLFFNDKSLDTSNLEFLSADFLALFSVQREEVRCLVDRRRFCVFFDLEISLDLKIVLRP